MQEAMNFLVRHGPIVLFLIVLGEQLGLPLPAPPLLLAMGALAATGHFTLPRALLLAVVACRIALEPDSCVRTTENVMAGRGARVLLYAKFLPGLSTVAPPVAGLIRMP